MLRILAATAALLAGIAPAHADPCWGVIHLDGGNETYVDLDLGSYTEYRILPLIAPPENANPGHYRVMFSLLIDHDIATDAMVGSSIVAEAREPDSDKMVMIPEANAAIEVQAGDTHVSGGGDAVTLIENPQEHGRSAPDPVAGRALYESAVHGGTLHMRFRADRDGQQLDATRDAAFLANPAYQDVLRTKARALAAERRQSGKCPLEQTG